MKTLALVFAALLVMAGAAPVVLAQDSQQAPATAPQNNAPAPAAETPKAPEAKAPEVKAPDAKVDVNVKTDSTRDDGAASPRTEVQRTGFFGLSPTAAIIVSVAVLLVVVLAIVAMTNSGGGTTYIDTDRRM